MATFSSKRIVLVLLCMGLAGCSLTGPRFTQRYEAVQATTETGRLSISAFSLGPPSPPARQTIGAADPRVQVAAINALSKSGAVDQADVSGLLAATVQTPGSTSRNLDLNSFRARVAITSDLDGNTSARTTGGDRIEQMEIQLELKGGGQPVFASWERLASDKVQIDLGDLSFKQAGSSGLEAGLTTLSPDLSELGLSLQLDETLEETIRLRQTITPLYAVLESKTARLKLRGAPLSDLSGVNTIDFTVRFGSKVDQTVVQRFQSPSDGTPASLKLGLAEVPNICTPLTLDISANGRLRKIVEGDETITESDDTIQYWALAGGTTSLELVSRQELDKLVFIIKGTSNSDVLFLEENQLYFLDYNEAERFLGFLRSIDLNNPTISGQPLSNNRSPLMENVVRNFRVESISLNPACNAGR